MSARRTLGLALALAAVLSPPSASANELLSQPTGFAPLSGAANHSEDAAISADGRYVAFSSHGDGLSNADDDTVRNVYVRDRVARTTTLVSRDYPAPLDGPVNASSPAISGDGAKVAFAASPVALDFDDVQPIQIVVRDLAAGTTTLVSRASGDGAIADTDAFEPAISADGLVVAFVSGSTALGDSGGANQVWRRELTGARATTLVSRANGTAGAPSDGAFEPAVDDDGSRIAFSTAAALDATDANARYDVYRRDVATSQTVLVSTQSGNPTVEGSHDSSTPAIDGDGDRIAFQTPSSNLGSDGEAGYDDIFVRSIGGGDATVLASVRDGSPPSNAHHATIDASGDAVGYELDERPVGDVEVRHIAAATTTFVAAAKRPVLARGGLAIAFESDATDLRADDPDDFTDVYAVSAAGPPDLVSRPSGDEPWLGLQNDVEELSDAAISADAAVVVFTSSADGLSGEDDDRRSNVFVRHVRTGTTTWLSRASGVEGGAAVVSADGRRAAWVDRGTGTPRLRVADTTSGAPVPVPGDEQLYGEDVALTADGSVAYARAGFSDRRLLRFDLVEQLVTAVTDDPVDERFAVSADDRRIAYARAGEIHVRTRATGAVRVFTHDDDAGEPQLSADGTRLAYLGGDELLVVDLTAPNGAEPLLQVDEVGSVVLSGDGRTVAYRSTGNDAWAVRAVGAASIEKIADGIDAVALDHEGSCAAYRALGGAGANTVDFRHVFLGALRDRSCPLPQAGGGGGPAPEGPAPAGTDRTKPRITRLSLTRKHFRVSGQRPLGTAFRLALSEQAAVQILFQRCARRCGSPLGSIRRNRIGAGGARIAFSGRIGRRLLRPGRYRATVVATDRAGNRSQARAIRFTVVS